MPTKIAVDKRNVRKSWWYAANRERMIAKARAWEVAHPERAAEKKREYLERHPERRKETSRRYGQKLEVLERSRQLAAKPEQRSKARALRDHYRDTLHDCYVRRVMAQRLGVKGSDLPQTLVDAQRELMKLKRELMK
jgi:hypothetical protein